MMTPLDATSSVMAHPNSNDTIEALGARAVARPPPLGMPHELEEFLGGDGIQYLAQLSEFSVGFERVVRIL